MLKTIARIVAPVAITGGVILGGMAIAEAPAFASTPQICAIQVNSNGTFSPLSPCMDEYGNGGGVVASYAPYNTWENFQLQATGVSGQFQVHTPSGFCVGDYANNPNNAVAGDTESCPTSGVAGWGTIFTIGGSGQCPVGSFLLDNKHWGGALDGAIPNGSTWYLNNASGYCLSQF